jgi:hypothetical protein
MSKPIHHLRRGLLAAFVVLAVAARAEHTFTSVDIGDPKPGSTPELVPGKDFEIRGFGSQFGGHKGSSSGRFVYTKLKGDFDIIVQVRALENEDQSFGEFGLMARKDLEPKGLEVGQWVSCNYFGEHDQYRFLWRHAVGGSSEPWEKNWVPGYFGAGSFGGPGIGYFAKGYAKEYARPRPFPYVWLRLIRTGNTYRGLIKEYLDSWQQLGMTTLDLGEEVYVGMAIAANHHQRAGGKDWSEVATNVSLRNLTIKQ